MLRWINPDGGNLVIDEATHRLVEGEPLVADLFASLNAHTHVAPMGGTTPPASPAQPVEPGASTASSTVKLQS